MGARETNEVIIAGKASKAAKNKVHKAASVILSLLNLRRVRLEIALVPGEEITALKRRFFMSARKTADVLAFPAEEGFPYPETSRRYVGEVYLNRRFLKGRFDHFVFLLLHGVLHLLGYEHGKKRDILKMEKLERALIKKLRLSLR